MKSTPAQSVDVEAIDAFLRNRYRYYEDDIPHTQIRSYEGGEKQSCDLGKRSPTPLVVGGRVWVGVSGPADHPRTGVRGRPSQSEVVSGTAVANHSRWCNEVSRRPLCWSTAQLFIPFDMTPEDLST